MDKYEDQMNSESPLIRARKRIMSNLVSGNQEQCMSYHHKRTPEDMTLSFESSFESGNLFLA